MTTIERSDDRDRSLAAAVPDPLAFPPATSGHGGGTRGRRLPRRTWFAAMAGVVILPLLVAATITFTTFGANDHGSDAAAARVVSAADLEAAYGIRVKLVAITAAGGLVDVRFTVTDKERAAHIFHDALAMPELFVETSGAILAAPRPMAHKLTLLDGATYFLLFPNAGGVIQPGTTVSVVIDDIRLSPIAAQS